MLTPGDIFTTKLPDGRYTAVRVLRTRGQSSLLSTTPYLARKRPALTDPLLRKVLHQRRAFFRGDAARVWLDGQPPKSFTLLGNLPLTPAESKTKCETFGSNWNKSTGNEAYLEWRWLKDRPAFQAESRREEREEELALRKPAKPKKMIDEKVFWSIINLLDQKSQRDDDKVLAPAIQALAARPKSDIAHFEERLAYLLYQLDTRAHAAHTCDDPAHPDHISADAFLYARCAVVASGKRLYQSVLKHPSKMPKDTEFEPLLSLASEAHEQKTGQDLTHTPACSYESFSNPTGWK
jgi:hypothetical protein